MRKSLSLEAESSAISSPTCLLLPRYCIRRRQSPAALLRMVFSENRCPLFGTMRRLPSWRSIVTSAPKSRHFRKAAGQNGPSVHLSHAGSDQDLSAEPEGVGERQPGV